MAGPGPLGAHHKKVERLRRLVARRSVRSSERAFVIEGETLVAEALDAGVALEAIFVAPTDGCMPAVVARAEAAGLRVFGLAPGVLERVAGTVTPQPVMAIAPMGDVDLGAVTGVELSMVCIDVRDPGNAGSVLRCAEAAGAGAVVFCTGSVDLFNPKTVRASAGSIFHVPVVAGGEPAAVLERLGTAGVQRLGTVPRHGEPYDEIEYTAPSAIVLGNEAHGLPPELDRLLDRHVTIPMAGRSESLNVSMAAALMGFEALRQRRRRSSSP